MRGLVRMAAAAAVAVPTALVGVAAAAAGDVAAQVPVGSACDAVLVDHAGYLSEADAEEIEQAARAFRSDLAYEIRIRIMTQEQAPYLEGRIVEEELACESWRNPNGGFRENLLVLAFTTDTPEQNGETLLLFGDRMPREMDDAWPRIQADTINHALNDDDWTGGITGGLADIREVVDPPAGNAGVVAAAVAAAVGGTTAAGAGGGVLLLRRRKRGELTGRFERSTAELDTLTLRLDPRTESLRRDIELMRTAVADEELGAAIGSSEEMLDSADQLVYQRSEISADRDQLLKQRSLAKVADGVVSWEALEKSVRDLLPELEAEETRMAALLAVRDEAPQRLARIASLADDVRQAEAAAAADGYVTTTDAAVLGVVDERVTMIGRQLEEKRLIAVDTGTTELIADLEHARDALGRMAQRAGELGDRVTELEQAQADVVAMKHAASDADRNLHEAFAESIYATVSGNVDTGGQAVETAATSIIKGREALDGRDLGVAEVRLEEAAEAQAEAQSMFGAVTELLGRAQRLQQSVPDRHRTAAANVSSLQNVVARLGSAATTGIRQQVTEIEAELGSVDVKSSRPDWIALNQRLDSIEEKITKATKEAEQIRRREEERQRRESQRRHGSSYSRSFGSGGGSSRSRSRSRSSSSRGGSSRRSSGGSRRGGSSRR